MSAPSLMMLPSATACACGHRFGLHAIGVPHGCTEDDCTCGAFVMTTPDPVLAATTADVRRRCDELEAEVDRLEAALEQIALVDIRWMNDGALFQMQQIARDALAAGTTAEAKRQPRDPVVELVEAATLYMVAHPCHASEGPCETERRLDVAIRVAKEMKRG